MQKETKTETKQLSFPFEVFEEEMISPLKGVALTEIESFVASLLLSATSEKPMKTDDLRNSIKKSLGQDVGFRQIKIIIRNLRRNHAFPILSRRSKPAGLWWCHSIEEMKEFTRMWQSQYYDEITTLSLIIKTNYPRLAGQMRISDIPQEK